MKTILAATALLIATLLPAAQEPRTAPAPQLAEFSALPLYDGVGNLTSLHCTAKFKVLAPQPDGRTWTPVIRSVEFDLVQQAGRTVILGGQLVEYGEIVEDIVGLCAAVYRLQNPAPLPAKAKAPAAPPRRKDLREPAPTQK